MVLRISFNLDMMNLYQHNIYLLILYNNYAFLMDNIIILNLYQWYEFLNLILMFFHHDNFILFFFYLIFLKILNLFNLANL